MKPVLVDVRKVETRFLDLTVAASVRPPEIGVLWLTKSSTGRRGTICGLGIDPKMFFS